MNKFKLLAAGAAACLFITGCSSSADSSSSRSKKGSKTTTTSKTSVTETITEAETENQAETTAAATEPAKREKTALGSLPVLYIETVSTDPNVMDFVTEPIAAHVSEAITSWTPGYIIPPEPYYEECRITLMDTDNTMLLDSVDADVKVRGNWTTMYEKKPLRLKFKDKQGLLGLNGGAEMKNWVLLASYKDGSMLRDKTALDISKEILGADGLYSPDSQLVEVVINDDYYGVYLLTERLQVSKNRVNINDPKKDYEGTDIGYFMEFDGYFTTEDEYHGIFVDYADNAPLVPFTGDTKSSRTVCCLNSGGDDPKSDVGITIHSDIYSSNQTNFIRSYMNNVYRIMYYAAYEHKAYRFNADYSAIEEAEDMTPQQAVELAVDVASLADMYIISELTCDADIYWSSFYMDVDFSAEGDKKLRFEAPWDFDSSMGNKDRCANGKGFYAANIVYDVNDEYETINPWLAVLMQESWFRDIIREKWTTAYDSGVFERAVSSITSNSEKYQDAFTRNYSKWNNIINNDDFVNELSYAAMKCRNETEAADYLAEWLSKRVKFLNDYWHE